MFPIFQFQCTYIWLACIIYCTSIDVIFIFTYFCFFYRVNWTHLSNNFVAWGSPPAVWRKKKSVWWGECILFGNGLWGFAVCLTLPNRAAINQKRPSHYFVLLATQRGAHHSSATTTFHTNYCYSKSVLHPVNPTLMRATLAHGKSSHVAVIVS